MPGMMAQIVNCQFDRIVNKTLTSSTVYLESLKSTSRSWSLTVLSTCSSEESDGEPSSYVLLLRRLPSLQRVNAAVIGSYVFIIIMGLLKQAKPDVVVAISRRRDAPSAAALRRAQNRSGRVRGR